MAGRMTSGSPYQAACRDMATGKLIWSDETPSSEYTSPAFADGKLFILVALGRDLLVLNAETGQRLTQISVGALGWTSPIIADGKIYVRLRDDGMACYDLSPSKLRILPELSKLQAAGASDVAYQQQAENVDAMHSGLEPSNSADHSMPHCGWDWGRQNGKREWVQYTYTSPRQISEVSVYWYSNPKKPGDCNVPQSWQLEYKDGDTWKPVETGDPYGVAPDIDNRVTFKPVTTTALRITVQAQPDYKAGILQWRVKRSLPPA